MSDRSRSEELDLVTVAIRADLDAANRAREVALPACRSAIRSSGSAIRAVHQGDIARAEGLVADARRHIDEARDALVDVPSVLHAGFVHDAEKEYAEAEITLAIVDGRPLPAPERLGVEGPSYLRGLAEAASELRRNLLDRLREDEHDVAESLLATMDDVYSVLVTFDYPDALTNGLRRTVDQLRAVLERSRGDLTTAVLQTRLRRAIDDH